MTLAVNRLQSEETTVDKLEDLLLYLLENTTADIFYSFVISINIASSVINVNLNSLYYVVPGVQIS